MQTGDANFNMLWGNLGVVRAVDRAEGAAYALVAHGQSEKLHLAKLDLKSGKILSHPQLTGSLGSSSEGVLMLAAVQQA